jgi:hypothetical protein
VTWLFILFRLNDIELLVEDHTRADDGTDCIIGDDIVMCTAVFLMDYTNCEGAGTVFTDIREGSQA